MPNDENLRHWFKFGSVPNDENLRHQYSLNFAVLYGRFYLYLLARLLFEHFTIRRRYVQSACIQYITFCENNGELFGFRAVETAIQRMLWQKLYVELTPI